MTTIKSANFARNLNQLLNEVGMLGSWDSTPSFEKLDFIQNKAIGNVIECTDENGKVRYRITVEGL